MTTNRRFSLDLLDKLKPGGNNTSDSDPDQPATSRALAGKDPV